MPLVDLNIGAGPNAPDDPPGSPVDTQYEASLKHNANLAYLRGRIAFYEARVKMRFIVFYPGKPSADMLLTTFQVQEPFTFAAGMAGCSVRSVVGATDAYVISFLRGETQIGTATFSSGGQAGAANATLATTPNAVQAFAAGDQFTISAQTTPDATFLGPNLYMVAPWNPLP